MITKHMIRTLMIETPTVPEISEKWQPPSE